jgi:hypothetical protein
MNAGNLNIKWRLISNTTVCLIEDKQKDVIIPAFANCSPKDHFCRDTGRKVSLAKALKAYQMPKEERVVIWELYRRMTTKPRW